MSHKILISITFLFSLFYSFNASACDDKACETAYLAETTQHVANHIRKAKTFRAERVAHALNRERHDYALYVHRHLIRMAQNFVEKPLKNISLISLGVGTDQDQLAGL